MSTNLLNKKMEYWQHQLLDLGKRNRMINYRETKRSTLKLVEPSFEELFQRLAIDEETLTFQRSIDRETDIRVFSILSLLENLSSPLPVTIGDIKTEGSILDRQRTLKNMRSKARLSLEEQGTNILYLSFGFIEWRDGKGASAQWIKSPLILLPTVLSLDALNSPYTLSKHEDDIVVNPTLQYYLKTEHGIEIPNFDPDKDTLTAYLEDLEAIADQRGWRILRDVSLGLLSFLKITMYNDLVRNEARIKRNPVIKAMAGALEEVNEISEELRTFDLDTIKPQDCYQVMSADSSQQDAILYSKNNISFVMQGPPGTGKSQTITNIIAEALADGKRVLFVSEKMAALQVVYRRLQDAHLADFCLPLHSYKANKKEILEQIGANLTLKQTRVKDTALNSLEELLTIRQELNRYASELHQLNQQLNISCYEVYSKLEAVNEAPSVSFVIDSPLDVSQAQLQLFLSKLQEYSLAIQRINYQVHDNPWDGLLSRTTGYEYSEKMRRELCSLQEKLHAVVERIEAINESPSLISTLNFSSLESLIDVLSQIIHLPKLPDKWLYRETIPSLITAALEAQSQYEELFALEEEIALTFTEEIFDFDYNAWIAKLLAEAKGFVGMPLMRAEIAEFYIDNAKHLQDVFDRVKTELDHINSEFETINSAIATCIRGNRSHTQYISKLLSLIQRNEIIAPIWFSGDISKTKATIEEAKANAIRMGETKAQILNAWEADILDLDFAPMLLRYKTEYTSFFKVFNSQYRSDKKQLQGLSKVVIKKLPDDVASAVLLALKDYHDQVSWFENNHEALQTALFTYYNGVDTKWDDALAALETAEKLRELPTQYVTPTLIEILAVEHSDLANMFDRTLTNITAAFSRLDSIITSSELTADVSSSEFDSLSFIKLVNEYLRRFSLVVEHKKYLKPYLIDDSATYNVIYHAIDCLNSHKQQSAVISDLESKYTKQFGTYFNSRYTNWGELVALLYRIKDIQNNSLYNLLRRTVNQDDARRLELNAIVKDITDSYRVSKMSFGWLSAQFDQRSFADTLPLEVIIQKVQRCLSAMTVLEGWVDYQEAKNDCCQNGLLSYINVIEENRLFEDIEPAFLKGFYHMWLGAVCDKSASVRRFRKNVHEERVDKFIELDDLQLAIAQMRIREKLIEKLPSDHQLLKATDEVAILKRELSKKRNIMPLRKLFKSIPNLLMKLKPCLMMSPLSVSYFLETEAYNFDIVIFDEASQIFPEDAIGAIFRGSQVIIAGDSKQLPPTNFFSASTNNFDGEYDLADEEDMSSVISDSILEESASVLPNRTLLWHYRSKNEGLIAFSNREIYKNNLITFPNSVTQAPDMGVEYIYVEDGYYEGSGKNCNIKEAQRCVQLVLEHIQKHPDRSLGIIAFSEKQQTAIENAIIDFRERNPRYEWFFDEAKDEPFFVKNLENVQGDERDTIIFSICYAKDRNGKMYMRFGPLGHEGGERRLNVAITRAKCNIKLVGSILPADIDLSRTKSEGVRMLRSYIEFARKGTSALKPVEREEGSFAEDGFCDLIASFLEQHGYAVEREVGCSDYKIDIAVINPHAEGEYIAGIECDGLSYIHAKTARDRDHLRRSVLQNMGWNMYRVWSTEWIRNSAAEETALLDFLRSVIDSNGKVKHAVRSSNSAAAAVSIKQIASETTKVTNKKEDPNPYGFAYYKEAKWWEAPDPRSNDNLTRISNSIRYVVSVEQPMHMEMLYKRLAPTFSAGKVTEGVKSTIDEAIAKRLNGQVRIDNDRFIRLLPEAPVVVRIPERYDTPRPMEYVHTEEVAVAMIRIIESSFGITIEDLATECARAYGFERKGPKIRLKTDAAIQYLQSSNKIRIIDDKVSLA